MKKILKKFAVTALAAITLTSAFMTSTGAAQVQTQSAGANKYGLTSSIRDGAILHAWSWSFNTIKDNLKLIAESGYTSVQTSPINKIIEVEGGGMQLYGKGKWYYQYQPTMYTIGNYQLGTLEEFKAMCAEADKYGIKIIVDAVVNHCTSQKSAISNEIINLPGGGLHPLLEIDKWSSRYQVTQGKLSGLWDLNTQNPAVQQMILGYLKDCVAAGADGFRYDAAKHIELPDDAPEDGHDFAGNFWNVILDNGSEFQYGEILQGESDRIADYAKLMSVTASAFGETLRKELNEGTLRSSILNKVSAKNVDRSQMVSWVESHDNYCGGKTYLIDNQTVRYGWAVVGAGESTPLFFSRPDGSSTTNQWGNNRIGPRGDSNFFHPEVVAVNHFRNATVGESVKRTNLKDANGKTDSRLLMIQRGDKGAVIINMTDSDYKVNASCNTADGEYTDEVSGAKFTVSDGKITGTVKAEAVAVVYNRPEPQATLIGDVNDDGKVNGADAGLLSRLTSGWDGYEEKIKNMDAADINGDGKVNGADSGILSRYTSGWDNYDKYFNQ
ncbi:MAG: alpha-amylase family glycosyl hydrolase [Ruminococcus sp.]|nr:alpha-amylase family glycosyl hydrolase [Ruminococcus sp.]